MMANEQIPERRRRSGEEIKRLVIEFEASGFIAGSPFAAGSKPDYRSETHNLNMKDPKRTGAELISARASRQDASQFDVNISASTNDEELVAQTVGGLQKLVLPFADVKIPRQFLSEKLRTDLFKHQVR
jgi:hypothetical protein